MEYDTNMEYHIRFQHVVGHIGHNCMRQICQKMAETKGHQNLKSFLNEGIVISQINQLRGIKDCGKEMKNVLTERQWFSLYKKINNRNGECRIEAREDVENMLDISLVHTLMKHVFSDIIDEDIEEIKVYLDLLLNVKEQIDGSYYLEKERFLELFEKARKSLVEIARYSGDLESISQDMINAERDEIQNLVDENLENYLKLRMLLKDPAERIMRSTMDVSMSRAGFKDREEMFENKFVQSELSRKAFVWSNNRGCGRSQRSFLGQIFDISGHFKSVKESIVQCLSSFDFDFMYKMMRDLSVFKLELTPYTKEGVMSFVKNLRDIYGQVMRGCPDNKIGMSDFRRYWSICEEALKVLLQLTGCSYDEDIPKILKMKLKIAGSSNSNMGNPLIFRVRLEFPPDGLTKYEFARTRVTEALRKHDEEDMHSYLQLFDKENHDLIFVHHEHQAATETCECFFDAEANLTRVYPSEILGPGRSNNRNPVVCLVDPKVHQMSGRYDYIGFIGTTTLEEIATTNFTNTNFRYLFDAKYCSESEKRPIYMSMQGVLTRKLSSVIEGVQDVHGSNYLITILEKHLKGIREDNKGIFSMSKKFKDWLRRETPNSVKCFSVSSKVKIYFKDGQYERLRKEILQNKFAEESDLEFVKMDDALKFIPLFKPGTHIYRSMATSRSGSIALYGKRRSNSKRVAVSHGHVIQEGETAYFKRGDDREELGNTIHPPYDDTETYPGELSVVEVTNEEVRQFLEESREQHKKVVIYNGETAALDKKKVEKFGSGTKRTFGFVVEASLHTDEFGDACDGIVIEEEKEGRFAGPGDSGALVYMHKGRRCIEGISLIYSEFKLSDYKNVVLTSKFHDCKLAFEGNKNDGIEFESDHGLSVMTDTEHFSIN